MISAPPISGSFILKLCFGLCIAFTFTYCTISKKIESSFLEKYYGKVKTVKTISYEGTDTIFLTIENFNVRGEPTRMEYYIHNYTTPHHLEEFVYDSKGNKIQTI